MLLAGVGTVALCMSSFPALADGGQGGGATVIANGGADTVTANGPAGAGGFTGQNGSNGTSIRTNSPGQNGSAGTGGSGGAAGGGAGGQGGEARIGSTNVQGGVGGAGGTALNPDGGNGAGGSTITAGGDLLRSGGGGGGGGYHGNGPGAAVLNNTGSLTGGNGGTGAGGVFLNNGNVFLELYGGGGGAGGYGAVITAGGLADSSNSGVIRGGRGGIAGGATGISPALAAHDGDGGIGVFSQSARGFTNSGEITGGSVFHPLAGLGFTTDVGGAGGAGFVATVGGFQLTNTGTITGGNGGRALLNGIGGAGVSGPGLTIVNSGSITGGNGGTEDGGIGAAGGAGVIGAGLTVINSGGVTGGLATDGTTRANAVTFIGGINVLELQAGYAFTGNVVVAGGTGTLRLGGSGAASFDVGSMGGAAQYQGFGAFEKTGSSTWTITGSATYAGPTNVNAGGLIVDGSLASSSALAVNGGFVGGTGTLPSITIGNGAALSPGNSIGWIRVQGDLTFNAGGIYTVELSPGDADRTNVTGTATLNGATVQAIALPGSFRPRSYTILNATGGVTGEFGGLLVSGSLGLSAGNPQLTYDANNVYLVLDAGRLPTLPAGTGGNPRAVANAINNAVQNGATPPAGFDALLNLSGNGLVNALNQLSGEAAAGASLSAVQMMNAFLSTTLNPFGGAPGNNPGAIGYARAVGVSEILPKEAADAFAAVMPVKAPPAARFDQRWSVWGQGFGGYNKTDGSVTAGSADTSTRAYGFAAGADYRVSRNTTLGFALAGGETRWSLANGLGGGRSDVFQAGVYGSHSFGAAYIAGALAYAWYDTTTDRSVTVAGLDMLRANFDSHSFGGRLEGGYRFATPIVGVTPYGAAQVQNVRMPGYAEAAVFGANTFALSYGSRSTTATRFELGTWLDRLVMLNRGDAVMLRGRVAWAHDDNGSGGVNAVFQTLPGSNFTVNGAEAPKNLALVSAGGEYRFANGLSLGGRVDGEFASRGQTYAGTGTVRYIW